MNRSKKWFQRTLIATLISISGSAFADISSRTSWSVKQAEDFMAQDSIPSQYNNVATKPTQTPTNNSTIIYGQAPTTHTPSYGYEQPEVNARAALVMDANTGEILYKKNTTRVLPIASVTKVMTAMVVLDAGLDLQERFSLQQIDFAGAGGKNSSSTLRVGDTMSRSELLLFALMKSENPAAAALGRTYPGGKAAFVSAMNAKAQELGMYSSYFTEGTGLDPKNVSTAEDLARMSRAAAKYDIISRFSTTSSHDFDLGYRMLKSNNTNAIVRNRSWDLQLSKTGFINEAGRCVVMQANVNTRPTIVVLLGAKDGVSRTNDANRLFNWVAGLPQGI